MNKKCIVCRYRKTCLTYQLGGLRDGEPCDKFIEEPAVSEEEQERLQNEKANRKTIIKKLVEKIKNR